MISPKILPAHILRLYTWELLEANVGLQKIGITDDSGVHQVEAIIPLGDEPRISDTKATYLVYGFAEQSATVTREIRRGTFSLRIVSRSFGQVGAISGVLLRAFEGLDDSAANVNEWSSQYSIDLNGIRFTTLDVTYVEGGVAPRSEGGPVEGMVNIGYSYISQQPVKLFNNGVWS